MHGSRVENASLVRSLLDLLKPERDTEVLVCPPFPYLWETGRLLKDSDVQLGAQSVGAETQGAFTGEVSAPMLRDVGCRYVIVGHSERRHIFGESDALVARKFVAAQGAGLVPVLCVGETLDERESGRTNDVVARQMDAVLSVSGVRAFARAIVAYEPVWAIGTGRTATSADIAESHAAIGKRVDELSPKGEPVPILYGGSVKPENAKEIMAVPGVAGVLVGGASLDAAGFWTIYEAGGGA
jgi:triosephosphate isomerase